MRTYFLLTTLAASLLLTPASAEAQGDPDFLAEMTERLSEEGLDLVEGCDYVHYLRAFNNVRESWDKVRSLSEWASNARGVIPVFDILGNALEAATAHAADKSADEEARGMIMQLQNVCQVAKEAEEVNRIRQIYEAGHINMGNTLSWLWDEVTDDLTLVPGLESGRGQAIAAEYSRAMPAAGGPNAAFYNELSTTLSSTLRSSDEVIETLMGLEEDLRGLQDELRLRAELDEEGAWRCPKGYPEVGDGTERDGRGVPICGPVGPERSQQITAQANVLKIQILAIQQMLLARQIDVDAATIMARSHQARLIDHAMSEGVVY